MAGRNASAEDVVNLRPLCRECLEQIGPEALCSKACFAKDNHKKAAKKVVQITYGTKSVLNETDGQSRRNTHTVCSNCLAELPGQLRSLSAVVCRVADHSFKRGFRWLTPSNAIVRPTPFNVFKMSQRQQRYRYNHSFQECNARKKGYSRNRCIFPHSPVEEQWWNKWQEKGIDELSLTRLGKQFFITSRNESQQVVRVEAEQISVYADSPSQATASPDNTQQLLQVGLSAANYKTRMRTLMNLEMKQIEQRLSTDVEQYGRCQDGHMVFQMNIVSYNQVTLSMSSETGEFVKQSSRDVVLNCCRIKQPNLEFKAVIIDAKNGLKVQVVPLVGVNTANTLQAFEGFICATFKPDMSYWESLHKAVEDLQPRVITRILFPMERDFSANGTHRKDLGRYTPGDPLLKLDGLYQTDALNAALTCPPGPPFLLTGPFGTGKTRLIARLAHQILHTRPDSRVLICVHHIQTADSYLDSFFLKMQKHPLPCEPIRLLGEDEEKPSEFFFTPQRQKKDRYYRRSKELADALEKPRLLVTTTGAAMQLKRLYKHEYFTHIFIDEAAQCIEPEALAPLHLARKHTKILLAGDHLQVGPDDAVQCKEAKDNGLSMSLLRRLHLLYLQLEKDSRVADNPFIKCFTSSLLSNYRCDPGILRLPSNLFYESSLMPQVTYEQHQDVNYPLVFICTSMAQDGRLEPDKEVTAVLKTAQSLVEHWPNEWDECGEDNSVCLMARTYHQLDQLRRQMRRFPDLDLKKQLGMVIDKLTFAIQGLEFTAVLLSTAEEASGSHSNYGRSVVNERVFNTVLTRARALFVAFGNPFYLMDTEKRKGSGRRCWKEFLRRCIECNSIVMPESTTEAEKHVLFTKAFEEEDVPRTADSILESYEKEFRQRLDFSKGHWRLIERAADEVHRPTSAPSAAHSACHILECKTAREAEAVPLSTTRSGESFIIMGIKSRGRALHGAVVEVQPLSSGNPPSSKQRHGRVIQVVEQSPQRLFLCRMDPFNSNLFIPLDGKGPKLVNFPPISRRLLQDTKAVQETLGKDKKNPVACFDGHGLEKGIPRLKDVIPFEAAKNLIFLVKFIEWRPDRVYPMAAVIDIFPAAHTAFHTERMLKAAYSEMMTLPPPIAPLPQARLGLRNGIQAITVDSDGTQYFDDAISIVCKASTHISTTFTLGVHIVNVASQLPRDVARQVIERGSAVFLDSATVMSPLVPQSVSESLTLTAGSIQPCITVSADIVFTEQGLGAIERSRIEVKGNLTFGKTVIQKSNVRILRNFKFSEAQATLNQALALPCLTPREDGTDQLCNLYFVARLMREIRLGQPALLLPCHERENPCTVDVQGMVEELLLWANTEAAKYLSNSPVALLRCQPKPKEGWKELEQQRKVLFSRTDGVENGPGSIPMAVVNRAIQCLKDNPRAGKYLMSTESHYPQVLALNEKVQSLQNRASYYVKERREQSEDLPKHHSVGSLYTQFTSPLCRGFDILVQYALVANLDGTGLPFESKDLSDMARLCDQKRQISRKVTKEFQHMKKAVACFHNHYAVDTVVVSFQEKTLRLKAPCGQFATDALSLSISALNPSKVDQRQGRLTWKFKIFSADPKKPITLKGLDASSSGGVKVRKVCLPKSDEEGNPVEDMPPATFTPDCLTFRPPQWATVVKFLTAPNQENSKETLGLLNSMHSAQICTSSHDKELPGLVFAQVEVTKQVSEGSMLHVWVGSSHQGPLITTAVHVVQPVPFLSICHKHNANPSECFSSPILHNASLDHYSSLGQYISCWEEVLLAEAAQGSPSESELTVLQNTVLKWPTFKKVNSAIEESHCIPEDFVSLSIKEEIWRNCSSELRIATGDFICAQYDVPDRSYLAPVQRTDPELFAAPEAVRGVFHFVVAATETKEGEATDFSLKTVGKQNAQVSLRLQQVVRKADTPCTLQVIPCTVSYRRLYQSLLALRSFEGTLAADVALGRIGLASARKSHLCPQNMDSFLSKHSHILSLWSKTDEALQGRLNKEQRHAIRRALESSFFLIQGPPGTGKSETGAHLAYAFARQNKVADTEVKQCVLYCGPSNKAVNVVLEKLSKLCEKLKDIKILRIYSRTGEQVGRAGPRTVPGLHKPMTVEGCPSHLEEHTLHDKVLKGQFGDKIREYEASFEKLGKEHKLPSKQMVAAYKKCISKAEKEVLEKEHDIVLCTCNEAAGPRIRENFNVAQCIIDECGMAMEPESMAVIQHAQQVILIGDHKQLQPVLQNRLAEDNGLGRSLFERYADKCEREKVEKDGSGCFIQLKEQYRMHRQVCLFPSKHFYDGSLVSAPVTRTEYSMFCSQFPNIESFWPMGKDWPTVFYSVQGKESHLSSTEKVRLQSLCNNSEARKIVDILVHLIKACALRGEFVMVLTPYSAQVECIKGNLTQERASQKRKRDYHTASMLDLVRVQTINDSQGSEFPLVILSLVRSMPRDEFNPELVRGDRSWLNEHLGFVTNPHQICVGITRSKHGLIIVGNERLLSCDETWNKLIQDYNENRCIRRGPAIT